MKRIFEQRQISAQGKILPLQDFVLFCDVKGMPDPQKAELFAQKAQAAKEAAIPFIRATDYMYFERTGSREKEALQNRRRELLDHLLCAKLCKKEADIDKIIDLVWAIMEESNWSWPAHNYQNNYDNGMRSPLPISYGEQNPHHIDLLAAFTGATLAFALYLCEKEFDAVAPVISQKLRYTLNERILRPFLEQEFWWMGLRRRTNNWNPWCISNILTVCALTEKDTERRTQIAQRAMYLLDFYTDSLPDDGGCDEGPAYFGKAGASYFDALEVLWDMSGGKIDVYDHPFVRKIAEYVVTVHINGHYFANFADAPLRAGMDGCMLARYGARIKSESLSAFAAHMQALQDPGAFDIGSPYRDFKNLYTTNAPKDTVCPASIDGFMPDLQVMTKREFPAFDRGLCLVAKGGHNAESHNHCDVGSFIVYADGEPLLVDTGRDTYTKDTFNDKRYTLWFMNSSYHNLPTIGAFKQLPGKEYKAEVLSYTK